MQLQVKSRLLHWDDSRDANRNQPSGIGRGTAISIAQEGCSRLFLADIELDGLRKTRQYIREADEGVRVEILQVDIADEKSVQEMIHKCVSTFGRVDYALNIAGVVPQRTPIADVNVETYDKVVHINQHGVSLLKRIRSSQMSFRSAIYFI